LKTDKKLFYTQCCEGFTANTFTHIINGIYNQAGIVNASSHSGRRIGLTTLADKGVGVRVLMALAGYSQIPTTQRHIDLRPSVVRAAVELVSVMKFIIRKTNDDKISNLTSF
jgi:integrase/recombinase XerD